MPSLFPIAALSTHHVPSPAFSLSFFSSPLAFHPTAPTSPLFSRLSSLISPLSPRPCQSTVSSPFFFIPSSHLDTWSVGRVIWICLSFVPLATTVRRIRQYLGSLVTRPLFAFLPCTTMASLFRLPPSFPSPFLPLFSLYLFFFPSPFPFLAFFLFLGVLLTSSFQRATTMSFYRSPLPDLSSSSIAVLSLVSPYHNQTLYLTLCVCFVSLRRRR
ncbi:hypothetical protein BCV70DRAFT_78453 [Testicularia cyperi]|uniref:Transmembrane protein n=1 Tax=Testicularia cyperi TaxID=1882483 RepID=A0A317XTJ1_9BASI|nr:hypothetical protein BCV70DRAFT_78453 [Testicularia cyperi]